MSAAAPAPGAEPPLPAPPALPEDGPRLLLAPPPLSSPDARFADPSPELRRLAEAADSLLGGLLDAEGAAPLAPAHLR
ncbi:MAG TPA: hypothetical protein VE760_03590, partial [Acidimicrobiales bacterium]|nr:hypothetical protein [Acidimicrobiales bacterium]